MKKKGFTLVEILIVVVILGILAAIVIPQFTSASDEARLSSLTSDLQSLRAQIQLYHIRTNAYPATLQKLVDDGYMMTIPVNPFTGKAVEGTDWTYVAGTGALHAGADTSGATPAHSTL
jgi:general secretion pathway protein G